MYNAKQNEKGAIMVEIIAVIALLGVLGPLMFKQVISRNEEVENINMASEIRTVKEAFSAYILAHKQQILEKCDSAGMGETVTCSFSPDDLIEFLPDGFVVDGYNFLLEKYTPNDALAKPIFQGFIWPKTSTRPSDLKIRRAARIANLIGADGGLVMKDGIVYGTGGTWELDDTNGMDFELGTDATATYIATTGLDTYIPELEYEELDTATIAFPDDLALGKLHAWNYFSVGNEKPGSTGTSTNCAVINHRQINDSGTVTTAKADEIKKAGEGGCDPLFWVGSPESGATTRGDLGHVYVKNQLHIGRDITNHRSAFIIDPNIGSDGNLKTDNTLQNNQDRKIEVLSIDGLTKVKIDASGRIMSYGSQTLKKDESINTIKDGETEPEAIYLHEGQVQSNRKAKITSNATGNDENYRVDPAFTSVLNDIRLESRGGARLSELLPNYMLQTVTTFTDTETTKTINMPSCPKNYAPAIVVFPHGNTERKLKQEDVNTLAEYLSATSSVGPLTPETVPAGGLNLSSEPKIRVTIDSTTSNLEKHEDINQTGSWTMSFGYSSDGTSFAQTGGVSGIIQTYCVFDIEKLSNEDKAALKGLQKDRTGGTATISE